MAAKPGARAAWSAADMAEDTAGSAILEFALVLPILLALVAGSFEIGRALLVRQVMSEAVRAGARYLAQVADPSCRPSCSSGADHALALAQDEIVGNTHLPPATVRVAVVAEPGAGRVGVAAQVSLGIDLLGVIGLPRAIDLRAEHREDRVVP